MTGETIKTLAEYICKLKMENADFFRDYEDNQFDTNGVEVDKIETSEPLSNNEHPST